MPEKQVKIGIIGCGLMGREVASAVGRWCTLVDHPLQPVLTAVCDTNEAARDWFRRISSVSLITEDYRKLLESEVDVVYVAVPHNLHLEIYSAVIQAGKDLFGEKPFGIDHAAAQHLKALINHSKQFVRCSSEFPFLPGAQRAYQEAKSGRLGRLLQVKSGFLHSSDLDPTKPANWKRQSRFCGEIGVMGDLGMHVLHLPLRLGWTPKRVYAQLQKGYPERPDGKGGTTPCDTWDNATLSTDILDDVPMQLEMKRLAPGETNTWFFEALCTDGGVRYSTKDTKALSLFDRGTEQSWRRIDLGFQTPFKTTTGGIFEAGFTDCFLQMWASYLAEREGKLGSAFGCVTVDEAVLAHSVCAAALESQRTRNSVEVPQG
ncbi:MAG TPA: Gfo/Idh/MocA family oxidoreductase [Fimbriimonadaceae bacterium]